ncbi:MAG: hypothetical protein ACLTSX_00805 [Collinsella sp.]
MLSRLGVSQDGVMAFGPVLPTKAASVVRLMPDGTQWLVSDAMLDGGAARDPLRPLETDYSYLVTACSEVGTAYDLRGAREGRRRRRCHQLRQGCVRLHTAQIQRGVEPRLRASTELMDFADGGEAGGLPSRVHHWDRHPSRGRRRRPRSAQGRTTTRWTRWPAAMRWRGSATRTGAALCARLASGCLEASRATWRA